MEAKVHRGIGVSPGIAIGPALVLEKRRSVVPRRSVEEEAVADEEARFRAAVERARADLEALKERTGSEIGISVAQIFDAQLLMLDDEMFVGEIERRIGERRQNAEWAVKRVGDELSSRLAHLSEAYLRERGTDIDDLTERLLRILSGEEVFDLDGIERPVVLVAYDLTPSETAQLDPARVLGFATSVGGPTSHSAIMARSLEIPAVVGLRDVIRRVDNNETLVLDGNEGIMVIEPSSTVIQEYRNKQSSHAQHEVELLTTRRLPATTPDGFRVVLMANVESPAEADTALLHGAEGIGLYRSEFLYLRRPGQVPTEEDHFNDYSQVLRKLRPRPVVIRTLDLGGEKHLDEFVAEGAGDNPLMGLRGTRLSLHRRGMFRMQLRGLLRASVHGELRIIMPMISGVKELREAKLVIQQVRDELAAEEVPVTEDIPVGVMIEVPAAALMADMLAEEVDFFSIGTNDLIQYLLAVDRGNEAVAYLYEPLHPAVLRTIANVVDAARRHEIPVSLCGEMASDPLTAMMLVGLGIEELSMVPGAIPVIKNMIRNLERREAEELLDHALELKDAQEVEEYALERLMAHFPDGFLVR